MTSKPTAREKFNAIKMCSSFRRPNKEMDFLFSLVEAAVELHATELTRDGNGYPKGDWKDKEEQSWQEIDQRMAEGEGKNKP